MYHHNAKLTARGRLELVLLVEERGLSFSARELDVLRLIARGLSNGEIAQELHIGKTTVKTHVTHILQKPNLRDRVQAVVLVYQAGLFEVP